MVVARALGFRINDPGRAKLAVAALKEAFLLPKDADGFGIASFADNAALISRAQMDLPHRSFAELLGRPQGNMAIIQVRSKKELRPKHKDLPAAINIGPFRTKHLAAAIICDSSHADEATANREKLFVELPDFIKSSVMGHSESEALFFRIYAECYRQKLFEKEINPHQVAQAIHAVLDGLSPETPRLIAFGTGQELIWVSRNLPTAVVTVNGLSSELAEELAPDLVDTTLGRERLRRFVGSFVFGALGGPCPKSLAVPKGMQLTSYSEDVTLVIGKDMGVKLP